MSRWSGQDCLCVAQRTEDARRQVSGVLPDVTSLILDRSFVPIRIQQLGGALQQSFAFSILHNSWARLPATRCPCSSRAEEGRSGGCGTATTSAALQALLLTLCPSVSSAAGIPTLLFRLRLCHFLIFL